MISLPTTARFLSSVQGLQESVHRSVAEATEERAALVHQRAGLFGVVVLAIIAPFMGAGLTWLSGWD